MAPTGKALTGWQHQADRLAGTHTTLGTRAMAVADQARRRRLTSLQAIEMETDEAAETREVELASELELARAKIAGLERRMANEAASTRALGEQMQLLAAQSETAERRVAELERELDAARDWLAQKDDGLALKDNENHSLQASLDLSVGENARLSQRLAERDAALEQVLAKQEFLQSALAAAESECRRLTDDLIETCERRRTETGALGAQLETMSGRATTAETLLGETRECLLLHVAERTATEAKLAEATAARGAAERKINQLGDALCHEQCRIDELERSRLELIEATNTLIKAFQHRDNAFQGAAHKIESLNQRIAELQAEARRSKRLQAADSIDLKPASARVRVEESGEHARRKWAELAGELARLVKHRHQSPAPLLAAS